MPIDSAALRARIENAADIIGRCWPLQTFIAANPLAGFEDQPFDQAVAQARRLFGGRGYPSAARFRQAWVQDAINPDVLARQLEPHGITASPDDLLDQMEAAEHEREAPTEEAADDPLNRVMAKWLAAFLDQGQAAWPMPNRAQGFYAAWRALAPYDAQVPHCDALTALPERPTQALAQALEGHPEAHWEAIFRHHFARLPGWAAFIKWRAQQPRHPWQAACPITLVDYLAARLCTAHAMGLPLAPDAPLSVNGTASGASANSTDRPPLPALWLSAWEATYRQRLLGALGAAPDRPREKASGGRPDAQLVFCIDVRSEIIRRHVEQTGAYETFGYAGFFGIPMQYQAHGSDVRIDACPPIVDPKHRVVDVPAADRQDATADRDRWAALWDAGRTLVKTLKDNIAAAFGFVEAAGGGFGAAMAARTLGPRRVRRWAARWADRVPRPEAFCELSVDRAPSEDEPGDLPVGLTSQEKAFYAEAAFNLLGWSDFAPVVVFTGHGSETVNNPYKSSLDCGACAGNPGGPNARALAAICNDPAVRDALRDRGIDIPADTVFVAGEHNTTTDAVRLIVEAPLSGAQEQIVDRLRRDLADAQAGATAERAETLQGARSERGRASVEQRAGDWAETRPEWGLAGNAAFIVGPRALTADVDLEGRCFLHSYDWQTDPDGQALEVIMTAPLIVGEWINTQYYFSTVDNAVYGSGSKVTHNVVGKVGILQGNGGDLMTGLPLQSLQSDDTTAYHHPLRLLAVVQAPVDRVASIIRRNAELQQLFDHGWMALVVQDPEQDGAFLRYQPELTWTSIDPSAPQPVPPTPAGVAS